MWLPAFLEGLANYEEGISQFPTRRNSSQKPVNLMSRLLCRTSPDTCNSWGYQKLRANGNDWSPYHRPRNIHRPLIEGYPPFGSYGGYLICKRQAAVSDFKFWVMKQWISKENESISCKNASWILWRMLIFPLMASMRWQICCVYNPASEAIL